VLPNRSVSLPVCKSQGKTRGRIASEVPKRGLQQSLNRSVSAKRPAEGPFRRPSGWRSVVSEECTILAGSESYRQLSTIGAGKGIT
jgi:hypothetical protein